MGDGGFLLERLVLSVRPVQPCLPDGGLFALLLALVKVGLRPLDERVPSEGKQEQAGADTGKIQEKQFHDGRSIAQGKAGDEQAAQLSFPDRLYFCRLRYGAQLQRTCSLRQPFDIFDMIRLLP